MRFAPLLFVVALAACGPTTRATWMPEGSDDPCVRADGETLETIRVDVDDHAPVDEYDRGIGSRNDRHDLACEDGGFELPLGSGTYTIELFAVWTEEVHLVEEEDPWGFDVEHYESYSDPITFTVDGADVDLGVIVLKHDE